MNRKFLQARIDRDLTHKPYFKSVIELPPLRRYNEQDMIR